MNIKKGQLIAMLFEGRAFKVIVIDPDGLGKGKPSVGFGFRMMEKYAGIPKTTLSSWVYESEGEKWLKLPSGMALRVYEVVGLDGNIYSVVEAADWFELALDLLVNPGRTGKGLKEKLRSFIRWFLVKGFYAEAYVALKGVYTREDSRATSEWLEARDSGKIVRKIYTDFLKSQGCGKSDYGNWTDHIYLGLFKMRAKKMMKIWELMDGDPNIARNRIPKAEGLRAVRFCEDMTVRMFVDDLREAHDSAIQLALRKFLDIGG